MRVLLADTLASFVPGRLQDLGVEVQNYPKLSGERLAERLEDLDPHVLVVRSTKVTGEHFEMAASLALVIRAGAGVNTIDVATASERGVYVANCPGKNAAAVAELAIGHLINLDRRIADNVASLREGRWDKKGFAAARGLQGRTLALVGFGRIAQRVSSAAKALGMHVRVFSIPFTEEEAEAAGVQRFETPEAAVAGADAVSVHIPLLPETKGRIGKSIFEAMKPGAYFINTSRGGVVDQPELLRALDEKDLRAGLDVFADEPSSGKGEFTDAIAKHPNVFGTHHIGASTSEATEAVGEEVVRIVAAHVSGRMIPNCVNLAVETEATHTLVVRHADRVGVLAFTLDALQEAGINVQEMQNMLFRGRHAACARINIVGEPSEETIAKIRAGQHVYDASVGPIER